MLKFSIIVPAYNEEKLIGSCLESLVNLDYDKAEYEIIVVDNNSNDKTKEIVFGFSGVKMFEEKRQGNVFALIKGVKESQGEILVFTDADTRVPKNWLKNYGEAYQDQKVVCAGGGTKMHPSFFKVMIVEKILNLVVAKIKYFCGFNLSIRREIYDRIHGFDPKVNFNQDFFLILRAKKYGRSVFVKNNEVQTSSRRYKDYRAIIYTIKSLMNVVSLFVFKRSIFFEFEDIR